MAIEEEDPQLRSRQPRRDTSGEEMNSSHDDFERDKAGRPRRDSQRNFDLAILKLGVRLRFDEFSNSEVVDGLPGYGPHLTHSAMNHLLLLIDQEFGFLMRKGFFSMLVADRARANRFRSR